MHFLLFESDLNGKGLTFQHYQIFEQKQPFVDLKKGILKNFAKFTRKYVSGQRNTFDNSCTCTHFDKKVVVILKSPDYNQLG